MARSRFSRAPANALCALALRAGLALGAIFGGSDQAQTLMTDGEPRLGAVASENRLCSQIGTDLLTSGGNAADALVGTVLCVGVIGMYHSGIGGGGFILVRGADGNYEYIDARETAPAAAHKDMYKYNVNGSQFGGLSSGVPGEIRGMEYLHTNYGRLPWRDVVAPAIHVARDGFNVSHDLLRYMQFATREYDFLTYEPDWALDFAPNGTRVGLGDRMTRRRYADTLEAIAEGGADVFYTGAMANAMVRAVREHGGIMTVADLQEYAIASRPPVAITYRDYRLFGCGAPAGGTVVFSALKTVEGYADLGDWAAVNISTHRLDEATRFGFGERGLLGDPDHEAGVMAQEAMMLNATHAARKRGKISDAHTLNVSDYNPDGYEVGSDHGTSHVVAADASGMAVSITTTLNLIFGAQVMVPETGVILNDQMDDFSVPHRKNAFGFRPSPANYIRPRKRPLSSMTPIIVEHRQNRSLALVIGAAGGSRIATATLQNLWHVLDHGSNVSAALAQPRFHDQLLPNVVSFEWPSGNHTLHDKPAVPGDEKPAGPEDLPALHGAGSRGELRPPGRSESGIGTGSIAGFDNRTVAFLAGRGHNVTWVPPGYSSAQAVRLLGNGTFEAAGEPRQRDSGGIAV